MSHRAVARRCCPQAWVSPFDQSDIETVSLQELLTLPNGQNIFLKLMHEAIFEHLRALGLKIDYRRKRAYFPKEEARERKVTYQGRVRRATRTIVKARTRRDSEDVLYYEHKAMTFSVLDFAGEWALVLNPGYAFTRDGFTKPIAREKTNVLSTRRAARDFNPSVHHDVTFWLSTLSGESDGHFELRCEPQNDRARFAPTILLSNRLPTIAYNSSAFRDDEFNAEIDADLAELDAELAELAEAPEEEPGEEGGGDEP